MTLSTLEVWERFNSRLLAFIRRRVDSDEEADDVLQDVFLKIHMRIDTLMDEDRLAPWVYQVARNTIIDRHRRDRAWLPLDEGFHDEKAGELPEDDTEANLADGLFDLLAALPEKYRLAVELAEVQGMRQEEIANQLGLSLSGAKSRVQRGRAMLRQALLDCCHVDFDRRGRVMDFYQRQMCCVLCCPPNN